jgi:putative spermidine/putrescine transport system permease protein
MADAGRVGLAPPGPAPLGAPSTVWHRISAFFYRHRWVKVVLLLLPPLLWFGVFYLGSLASLLWQSLYRLDDFSGTIDETISLDTWKDLFTAAHRDVILRTIAMAGLVTLACVGLAYPIAYYMARRATPRLKAILFVLVMLPLWSSYLVRVYSWKLILAQEGVLTWFLDHLGLSFALDWVLELPVVGGSSLSVSPLGQWMVFTYVWLPYMILPVAAALERVPATVEDASDDLGAKPRTTFRRVTWPLALPGVVAGSIFTFSLTLGDYIIPTVIGNSSPSIGESIYAYQGAAGNLPLAAAFSVVPIVIMVVYLFFAKRMGAFESL